MSECQIYQTLSNFLQKHHDSTKPLLLALSGGPDSLVLFHLLLEYQKNHPLKFAIAHIDHGWRAESAQEADELQKLAFNYNLPFFLKKLDPKAITGNLEMECRKERLRFFAELSSENAFQAVLLAHHQDDQAETILKRILEGESLPYLAGMKEINTLYGATVWRPLLNISKEQIVSWLKFKEIIPFEDATNFDTKFLRGRFRTKIIPQLTQDFGKEVGKALYRLGTEALELRTYLDECVRPYVSQIQKSDLGSFLDLSLNCPRSGLEIKYLIRQLCENENAALTHHLVDLAAEMVMSGVADRQLSKDKLQLYIDRKRLFAVKKSLTPVSTGKIPLTNELVYAGWKISTIPGKPENLRHDWRSVWQGKMEVFLPEGDYYIGPPSLNKGYPRSTPLNKWWNNEKVPAFLRNSIPVIWKGNEIEHEFLTGRMKSNTLHLGPGLHIQLERII